MKLLTITIAALLAAGTAAGQRIHRNIDFDWRFNLGEVADGAAPAFDDSGWRTVDLPHDFSIEQPKTRSAGGQMGFHPGGVGWYRRTVEVPAAWRGRRVTILFDGAYHRSDLWVNGTHVGHHAYGYTGFEWDITPYLDFNGGRNILAVRVDHSDSPSSRWYSGSGINRSVWLTVTGEVRVATWGTYVTTPTVEADRAEVRVAATLENSGGGRTLTIENTILDAAGRSVARSSGEVAAPDGTPAAPAPVEAVQTLILPSPALWSPSEPNLYTMRTVVRQGRRVIDTCDTTFGVRTVAFDPQTGMTLNGQPVKMRGVNLHEDAGALGTAVPRRAIERRLEILKAYGANAIRLSHNPFAPEMLEVCDRLGFLVIDEAFDKWKSGYYEGMFDDNWQADLAAMIRRDRNHPSVVIWSVGNETTEQNDPTGEGTARAQMLVDFARSIEPTRPTMVAIASGDLSRTPYFHNGYAAVPDLIGFNYMEPLFEGVKQAHPEWMFFGSEVLPYYRGRVDQVRDYEWRRNPWYDAKENDWVPGYFIWPGIDYLGESSWPQKGWPGGVFETTLREKPRGAFLRSEWNPEPMVRIAVVDPSLDIPQPRDLWTWPRMIDHWNFPQYAGQLVQIQTITNCDEVELFVTSPGPAGPSGPQDPDGTGRTRFSARRRTADFPNNTITWWAPWFAGKIYAKGYVDGKEAAYYELKTAGEPAAIRLTADRTVLSADGRDLSFVDVEIVDAEGVVVPVSDMEIGFEVMGAATLAGVDSGNVESDYSYKGNVCDIWFGRAQAILKAARTPGSIVLKAKAKGLPEAAITLDAAAVR
jgi:beta-galactosidase